MPTVLALLMAVLSLGSQTAPDDSTEEASSARALQAEPATGSIVVDGHLDEEAWQSAPVATDFRQFEPNEGAPATHPTEVRILYGENNLYIGAYLYDSEPSEIEDALGRRDSYNRADWFTVYIDSHFDRRTAYAFAVNAAGVQLDGLQNDRSGGFGGRGPDTSWDAIWTSAARVAEDGWIVEMQIPYAMLRFSEASEQTWGVQFQRRIPRLSERAEWILIPRTERGSGTVSQYGLLTGMRDIEPQRDVQIRPYTVSSLETQEGEPQGLEASGDVDVGADLRIGLAPNLTLDATVNPDFGQVESDPAVLNLSAFETFFDEKRPFFVEGAQIFDFDLGRGRSLLYTRRIGAEAPIVGAAKVSGRTAEGLSLGVMGATTGEGFQPRRHYGVARLQQEFATYSSAGGILTAFNAPGEEGRRSSLAGGADWDLRFQDNAYGLEGWTSFTHRTQLEDDETNTAAETGFASSMEFERLRGAWTYDAGLTIFDDRFNPNDLGQMRRNNFFRASGGLDHEINGGDSFGPFQRADAGLNFGHSWSYRERLSQGLGFFFRSNWTLKSFQRIEINIDSDHLFGGYDLYETRGLGPRAQPRQMGLSLEFATDERRSWQLGPEVGAEFRSDGGTGYSLSLDADWSVGSRLTLSGEIGYEREEGATEWASNETFAFSNGAWQIGRGSGPPEALEEGDYEPVGDGVRLEEILDPVAPFDEEGRYYVPVFGARDTRSLDVSLRSNITFTPNLSLQLYGQLFAAKGQYERFQLLQNPDDLASFSSYPKRHDFSIRSFISNVVLRWEFQPGSRLYLVWSQSRRQDVDNPYFFDDPVSSPYETPTSEHLFNTFNLFPSNTFLVKLDYTFLW